MSDNLLGHTELEKMIIDKNMDLVSKAKIPIDNRINVKGLFTVLFLLVSANISVAFLVVIIRIMPWEIHHSFCITFRENGQQWTAACQNLAPWPKDYADAYVDKQGRNFSACV